MCVCVCIEFITWELALRVSVMMRRHWILAVALVYICIFWRSFVINAADEKEARKLAAGPDPVEIVSKALLCFNDKYIYKSCEESWRLNEEGNLKVPKDKTDVFCEGPCLLETNLVLSCLDNIFTNFVFYNKATILDIKQTIQAGCSNGPQRGNFDVVDHLQAEQNTAHKTTTHVLLGLAFIIMGRGLLL